MGNSFPKSLRLLSKSDFENLKISSRPLNSGVLRVFYMSGRDMSRMGLAISRKVGKAARRNRIKRILREEFRISSLKDQGFDFLVTVKHHDLLKLASFNEQDLKIKESFNMLVHKLRSRE